MNDSIIHRGPDSDGLYEADNVALGMRRLAIIDVAHGAQPVFNETRTIAVVFNGEIYNFRELQDELRAKGHVLESESDSECLPHLYEEYGDDFVTRLRGMFAIAVWDADRQRLLLARDRLGKKPLFYSQAGGRFSFASELKGLLVDGRMPRDIDEVALYHYLTYQYVPQPWSILSAARKVSPAHIVVFENGTVTTKKYWELHYRPEGLPDTRTEPQLVEELRDRLIESVRIRLMSERPLGAFLSGGLDSSAIVAAMARITDQPVKTFSIGFDEDSHNELPWARKVAERYGTEHHEYIVRPQEADMLHKIAQMFDEPFADSSAIPSYHLAQMTRNEVVVALNGDGGDEALGGYVRYERWLTARSAGNAVRVAARGAEKVVGKPLGRLGPKGEKLGRMLTFVGRDDVDRYGRFMSYFDPEGKAELITGDLAARLAGVDSFDLLGEVWNAHLYTDPVNRALAMDTYRYLPGDLLPKVDITTMAVSLEARSPLLDHEFMEWCAGLGGEWKVRGGTLKYLLKKALDPWLPNDLIHRQKQGFGIPISDWLRGDLRPLLMHLPEGYFVRNGYFRRDTVQGLIDIHVGGINQGPRLYALLMLEMWREHVLSAPPAIP